MANWMEYTDEEVMAMEQAREADRIEKERLNDEAIAAFNERNRQAAEEQAAREARIANGGKR